VDDWAVEVPHLLVSDLPGWSSSAGARHGAWPHRPASGDPFQLPAKWMRQSHATGDHANLVWNGTA